jgi:hypothetical protein
VPSPAPAQRKSGKPLEGKKEDSQHDQASNCVPCQKARQIGGKFIHRGTIDPDAECCQVPIKIQTETRPLLGRTFRETRTEKSCREGQGACRHNSGLIETKWASNAGTRKGRPLSRRAALSIRRLAILRGVRRVGAGGRSRQGYCENQVAEGPFSVGKSRFSQRVAFAQR